MLRPLLILAVTVAAAACYDESGSVVPLPPAPPHVRTLDLGDGVVATLGDDGTLTVTRGTATVVSSPPGASLFARTSDPASPDVWHDPTLGPDMASDLKTIAIDATTIDFAPAADGSSTKAVHLVVPAQPDDTALVTLALAADDGFYGGLGERYDHVDARGRVSPMFITLSGAYESGTNEAHVPVPFLVSSRGWGVFVQSREAGAFDVAATDPRVVRATFEGRALDVYIFVDPDPLAIVARFNRLAGLPRPMPTYALAPMHWRNHWASADEVIAAATEYRTRHIPASTLWLDDPWETSYNTFRLDSSLFADPAAMMARLAALGFRVFGWNTPYLQVAQNPPQNEAQQLFQQADANGWFVKDPNGKTWVSPATPVKGGAGIVDFTSADARAFWEGLIQRATDSGIVGFKLDYGEELVPNLFHARNEVRFADGTTGRTARSFPIAEHRTYHEALDKAAPGQGVLIVRASSYGGAAQADIVWPGDLDSGFEHMGDSLPGGKTAVGGLPAVVVAAQTLATSGFPAFGSDTAGYRNDPTRESLLRWSEHTALSVIMQLYGANAPRLPWAYDEDAATIYGALARLHQRLVPYNALLLRAARATGAPTIRSLPLAYPSDIAARAHADDEYLLGPELLVAPVLTAGATSRAVHIPPGRWIRWWTDVPVLGPTSVDEPAPLGKPPLYVRAGALVPLLPDGIDTLNDASALGIVTLASHAGEMEARSWVLGAASATLDDGSTIAIDDGASGVTVTWTPGAALRTLTIDVDVRARVGSSAAVTQLDTVSGAPLAPVADEAAVRASTGGAWAIDAMRQHAVVRFLGGGTARIR